MEKIKVLIADDLEIIIEGVEALLSTQSQIHVVGRALNGMEAVELTDRLHPDVLLMDISMPLMDGLEASKEIKKRFPDTRILILTMYDRMEIVKEALQIGVDGFLLKNTSKEELVSAIEAVMEGSQYMSRKVKEEIALSSFGTSTSPSKPLSKREKEIVKLVLQEMTTAEIADSLFLSPSTVETHRRNILDKLNVRNTAGLVKYAVERGW